MIHPAKPLRLWMHLARAWLVAVLLICLVHCPLQLSAAANTSTNWLTLPELLKKWEPVSLPEIQRLAEDGDACAQHYMGYCHAEGFRMARNPDEGASWYRRALQTGYLPSANNLGLLYQRGRLGTNDLAKAIELYRYAADRELAQAQANLGVLYRDGEGVTADPKEALKWFRLAASQGHPVAMVGIGRAYRFGSGVEKNLDEAIRWFEKAANQKPVTEQDRALARLNLGLLYGEDGEPDKAIPYYRQAAEAGQPDGMIQLYLCYSEGKGVEEDGAKAMEWLKKAADVKSPYAECLMGYRCENVEWVGEGRDRQLTQPDYPGALRWYRRSAEQGWAGGQYHLGMLYLKGRAVAPDEARALELIRAAADQDMKDAIEQLAGLYASGIGEPRNANERPVALLERIEKWRDLQLRYEHGLGTDRDLVMAARCYSKKVRSSGWNDSRYDLAEMIEFKPGVGGPVAISHVQPLDRHLTLAGPPHHINADASDDVLRVLSLYLKTARGDGAAAFQLGKHYETGINAPQSAPKAWAWFSIAAQNGNPEARAKLSALAGQMNRDEMQKAQQWLARLQADLKEIAPHLR